MGAGQVSIWVPIAVGVIGLVGVILGQLVNAWKEGRRWKREVAHQERQWRREARQVLNRERNRDYWEQQSRHLDRQFEACASMATVLHKWRGLFFRLDRAHLSEPIDLAQFVLEYTQLEITVDECIGRIGLVCDKSVASAATDAWVEYGQHNELFTNPALYKSLSEEQIENMWTALNNVNDQFLTAAQKVFKPSRKAGLLST